MVIDLLAQIQAITNNQGTVLLSDEHAEAYYLVIDEMVTHKDELISEVEKHEAEFNEMYEKYRGKITDKGAVAMFQDRISTILELKSEICEREKSNVLLMENRRKKEEGVQHIPTSREKVADAYKAGERTKILR